MSGHCSVAGCTRAFGNQNLSTSQHNTNLSLSLYPLRFWGEKIQKVRDAQETATFWVGLELEKDENFGLWGQRMEGGHVGLAG